MARTVSLLKQDEPLPKEDNVVTPSDGFILHEAMTDFAIIRFFYCFIHLRTDK